VANIFSGRDLPSSNQPILESAKSRPPLKTPSFFPIHWTAIMQAMATVCPLFEQVRDVLANSPYWSAKQFRIEAADGLVRLEGTVASFYQKQMAQELLRRVDGVERIENQLQVNWR
jgi:hypothetical protein